MFRILITALLIAGLFKPLCLPQTILPTRIAAYNGPPVLEFTIDDDDMVYEP